MISVGFNDFCLVFMVFHDNWLVFMVHPNICFFSSRSSVRSQGFFSILVGFSWLFYGFGLGPTVFVCFHGFEQK